MAAKNKAAKTKTPAKSRAAAKQPAAKKSTSKQAAARKPAAKKSAAKKSVAKQPAGRKPAARKSAARKPAAKKSAARKPAARQPAAKKSTTKRAATKQPATNQHTTTKTAAKPATKQTGGTKPSQRNTPRTSTSAKRSSAKRTPNEETNAAVQELPKPRFNKDGFGYTKDFDLSFVKEMYDLLQEERVMLTGQAKRLEDEAHQLVEEAEMGDVQFDDEGGEGDTMIVERERDLALSAQARETVAEIDAAIDRIMKGTYGYSIVSGEPIPRERLEAIPWAAVLVQEKVGGI